MSDRAYWRDVVTQHLVDQQPLTREQVESIHEADVHNRHEFEERMPGKFWHESFPPFPEESPEETVIELKNGGSVRCPAHPAPCDYVRVCDEGGEEIVYYDKQEWIDEPVDVMGALLGAMRMLTSDEVDGEPQTSLTKGTPPR